MAKEIYVNLPVFNLKKSMSFFSKLGFEFNKQFTDDNAACMIVGPNIYVMLLVEEFFQTFTTKKIIDAKEGTEVNICISVESREKVDEMVKRALASGAKPGKSADHGFMYFNGFEDLDGHNWEVMHMNPDHVEK